MKPKTERSQRWITGMKITGLVTLGAFLIGFVLGTLGGIADPSGGWAAWRVGLFTGVFFAGASVICGVIGTVVHASEP